MEVRQIPEGTVDDFLLGNLPTAGSPREDRIDLVITRDIPLAEKLVEQGVAVMNDRGRLFEQQSIRELRSLRDARAAIREQGLETMNRAVTYGRRELKAFADTLDRFLTQRNAGG